MNFTEKIAEQCNGMNSCEISAQPTYIHKCSKISDFLFISYKCYKCNLIIYFYCLKKFKFLRIFLFVLAENTIDICSNINLEKSTNQELLISSPEFPDEYLPLNDCSCQISSSHQTQALKLEILWFSLQDNDYLSISRRNFSGWINPTYEFPISSLNTTIRFTSDDSLAYKGFWFKLSQTKSCKDDWQLVGDTCVKVFSEQLDWRSANQKCNQMNSYLVKIDDIVNDMKLSQYMKLYYPEIESYWIGLRKYVDDSNQEKWMWPNSILFNDTTWWPWKKADQNGNCVVKRRNEDGYFTISCDPSNKYSFICQTNNIIQPPENKINIKCGKTSRFLDSKQAIVVPTQSTTTENHRLSILSSFKNDISFTSKVDLNKILQILPSITQKTNENQKFLSMLKSTNSPSTSHMDNKFNTTIIAGMVSGIGLVILIINILVLILCRRNIKKLIQNTRDKTISKQSDEMNQDYFDTFRNGILIQEKGLVPNNLARPIAIQNSNTLLIPVTSDCSSDELFSNLIRNKSLRKSAFKIVNPSNTNHQYDKMNHQIDWNNLINDQNHYFHTYECVDTLELPNNRRGIHLGISNMKMTQNDANYSLNSDFGFNSTSTSSSSTQQLIRNSVKNLPEGTWSPDSAYYSSIIANGNYQLPPTIKPQNNQQQFQQQFSNLSCINQNQMDNLKSHLV